MRTAGKMSEKKNSLKRVDGTVNNLESNKKTIITLQCTSASCIEQQRKSPNINLLISMKFLLVIKMFSKTVVMRIENMITDDESN